jgi:hypothetical protein
MESQRAKNEHSLIRLWPWLAVLLVLLLVAFIRFHLLDTPLERDEGEYAYAGQLILQGIPPYESAYNMKLPGTYYACALGMKIFGQTVAGIHLTLLFVNLLTCIFVFLLARKMFGAVAGVVSCATFAVLSVSPAVLGMAAHANHFVILFAVPATLLLWRATELNSRWNLFFSGLLYGLAFLMKQQGVFFIFFGAVFLLFNVWRKENVRVVRDIFIFGVAAVLPFAVTCVMLEFCGVFHRFWFWTFTYAHSYVVEESWKNGVSNLLDYLTATHLVFDGFWILALAGILSGLINKSLRRRVFFALFFFVCSFLATATGLYFRRHYFILILPSFSLFVGLAVVELQRILRSQIAACRADFVPPVLFAAVFVWNVFFQRDCFFTMSGNQICQTVYRDFPFIESFAAAGFIREHSAPDARIAVVGSEPEIYFYAQRRSATGYIYTYALMEPQPHALQMQKEMIREIETNQPEFLVWVGFKNSWLANSSSDPTIFKWFGNYSEKFYNEIAVVGFNADGELILQTNEFTHAAPSFAGQTLKIFRRKTD